LTEAAEAKKKKPASAIRLSMTVSLGFWLPMTQARQLLEPNVVEPRGQQPLHQGKPAISRGSYVEIGISCRTSNASGITVRPEGDGG
jgi:hypothetical protein